MLPPTESPDPGSSLPISANASALPWDSDPVLRSGTPDGRGAASLNVVSKAPGKFRDGELGWLASTCCNASARPPYQVPAVENTPSGSVRSEEHTSELQSRLHLVCRLLLEKKKKKE